MSFVKIDITAGLVCWIASDCTGVPHQVATNCIYLTLCIKTHLRFFLCSLYGPAMLLHCSPDTSAAVRQSLTALVAVHIPQRPPIGSEFEFLWWEDISTPQSLLSLVCPVGL